MTRCIVTGCPNRAQWQPLEGALEDYCQVHADEWLMAERDAQDLGDDWAIDARLERERAWDAGPS